MLYWVLIMVQILTHCDTAFFIHNSTLNIHLKLSRYFVEQPKYKIVSSIPTFHMCVYLYHVNLFNFQTFTQGVSRLVDITAGGDFLGLCDQKSSYKRVSDFGRLRSYGHFLIPVHAFV